jgi:hypothetical protein
MKKIVTYKKRLRQKHNCNKNSWKKHAKATYAKKFARAMIVMNYNTNKNIEMKVNVWI